MDKQALENSLLLLHFGTRTQVKNWRNSTRVNLN